MTNCLNMGIDYQNFIREQVGVFWSRAHLFGELSNWLAADRPRFFAIIGGPGTGKTAIAAHLAQIAIGAVPAPGNLPNLQENFLSGLHFCSAFDARSASDRRWYQPHVFAESVSTQLAARYLEFGRALLEKCSNHQITISSSQSIDNNTGQVIGINIENLDASRLAPEDAFSYLVREPLEELARLRRNERFVLLIDALDESLRYSGAVTIARLLIETSKLSPQVRFIVSARPGLNELEQLAQPPEPQMQIYRLDQEPGLSHSLQDIYSYVLERAAQPELSTRLEPGLKPEELAAAIRDRSAGNFLYVDRLLQMLTTGSSVLINQATLDALPKGLLRFYKAFLDSVLDPVFQNWENPYQPILGTLAVEREALNRQQLADISTIDKGKVVPVITSVRQLLQEDDNQPASQRTYAFYHHSLAEFLLDEDAAEKYWCEEPAQHERVADHYLPECEAGACAAQDSYGLRNVTFHLAEAAMGRSQPARHQLVETMVNLLRNPAFEQCYQAVLDDPNGWNEDLLRALRAASLDNHFQEPTLLIKLVAAYLAFRQKHLLPQAIFDLVRKGEIHAAERRLDLYGIDNNWRQVALLAMIWVAISPEKEGNDAISGQQALRSEAEALFKRIAEESGHPEPIPMLITRVYSALSGAPLPHFSLPPAPSEQRAQALVAKMGGMTAMCATPNIEEELRNFSIEPLNIQSEVLAAAANGTSSFESIYAAAQEAPYLVAYADQKAANHIEIDADHDYIGAYIRIHAANNYVRYRNGSLWVILNAVLQHRDQNWVRERLVELVTAALASSKLEYQENLPLALLAWQAQANLPGAAGQLANALNQACQAADNLQPQRGKNDTAGRVTRRLGALAEVQTRIFNQPASAKSLISRALNPAVFGFAGFYAPAALTLAEAIRVSLPYEQYLINDALNQAVQSAHRIQDGRFCAQTTARWNAMKRRWWGTPLSAAELENVIRAFSADPGDAGFCALHHRGEAYDQRPQNDPNGYPIPMDVHMASTLPQLAEIYERPLAEFERVNPVDNGTQEWVNVPDPGFTPLLAARLAAEALVVDGFTEMKRVELIQLLILPAVTNPTALDSVLARLLLAMKPKSQEPFTELAEAIKAYQDESVYRNSNSAFIREPT